MKQVRLWVHPDFKRKIKKEATEKDLSVLRYTQSLADSNNEFMRGLNERKKRFRIRI